MFSINKILAPVDFSETSLHAAHYACMLAKDLNAALYLVHVLELENEKLFQNNERKEEMLNLQNELFVQYGFRVELQLLTGSVTEAILMFSKTNEIDLLVLGSSGMGKVTRFLLGSVAEQIISNSNIPIVTVPAQSNLSKLNKILFATSRYEENENVINPLLTLARAFNAGIKVIFFHDFDSDSSIYIENAKKQEIYCTYLNSQYKDVSFQSEILEGLNFVDAIEAYEKEKGFDLVALVPYANQFLEKMRSTTRKIAFHSSIPALILPSKEEKRKEDYILSNSNKN
jgi:nucleotide-binding universal stress UspA family protein